MSELPGLKRSSSATFVTLFSKCSYVAHVCVPSDMPNALCFFLSLIVK